MTYASSPKVLTRRGFVITEVTYTQGEQLGGACHRRFPTEPHTTPSQPVLSLVVLEDCDGENPPCQVMPCFLVYRLRDDTEDGCQHREIQDDYYSHSIPNGRKVKSAGLAEKSCAGYELKMLEAQVWEHTPFPQHEALFRP